MRSLLFVLVLACELQKRSGTELGDKLSSISGWKQLFKSSKTHEGERLAQHELSEH